MMIYVYIMNLIPATVEESVHIQVHEDGEDLLVGEAVEARLVGALEAAEVVALQQILNGFLLFGIGTCCDRKKVPQLTIVNQRKPQG